jgi:hypothetical protein
LINGESIMQMTKQFLMVSLIGYCPCWLHAQKESDQKAEQEKVGIHTIKQDFTLFGYSESKAKYALPFCEKKNCIDIDIQSIQTKDSGLIAGLTKTGNVVQAQIG